MGNKPMPEYVGRQVPRTRKFVLTFALALAGTLAAWAPSAIACPGGALPAASLTVDQARAAVVCLINKKRTRNHVKPVSQHPLLDAAAQTHTDAMTTENFFSHEGDGTPASRAANAGYMAGARAWGVGEDLFWGAARMSTPRATVNAWMHSAPHRSVMLSKSFHQVGVGVDQGSPAGADNTNTGTYTADFGFRKGG
jgi:uncharacterized protein YkwD